MKDDRGLWDKVGGKGDAEGSQWQTGKEVRILRTAVVEMCRFGFGSTAVRTGLDTTSIVSMGKP